MRAPVVGGSLELHELAPGELPLVLALHGITANALSWGAVASAVAGRARVVAPDLRGRAGSRAVAGPWGLGEHADDVPAVLDHLGVERAVLAGHSMGAFVAALAAARHPERVSGVLLVDGGFGFPPPAGVDGDELLHAVLGPAMARLSMTFASGDAYLEFWSQHPAVGPALEGPAAAVLRGSCCTTSPATGRERSARRASSRRCARTGSGCWPTPRRTARCGRRRSRRRCCGRSAG